MNCTKTIILIFCFSCMRIFAIGSYINNDHNVIRIDQCETLANEKPYINKDFYIRKFTCNGKYFEHIYTDDPDVDNGIRNLQSKKGLSFEINGKKYTPEDSLQKKLINLFKLNGHDENCIGDPLVVCYSVTNYLFNKRQDCLSKEPYKKVEDKEPNDFSLCYLIDSNSGEYIHFMIHIAAGIFYSKLGTGKGYFHDRQNIIKQYNKMGKNMNCILATEKKVLVSS